MTKVIATLEKPKARTKIVIEVNKDMNLPKEDWFLDFKHIEKKTNKVKAISTITQNDIKNWCAYYEGKGWKVTLK
jgi:hypothetical protein